MRYFKVIDFLNDGVADYKGLDISQFIYGSQEYDTTNKVCVIATRQDEYTPHEDLQELALEEYEITRGIIQQSSPQAQEKTELENLRNDLNEAIMEMTMLIAMGGNA